MRGLGTIINVIAVIAGAGTGVLIGHRLPERTRITVTDALGLVTIVIGALNITALGDEAFGEAVGDDWTLLVVLGALVIGGIVGSLLNFEDRVETLGAWLQRRLTGERTDDTARLQFVEGFVTASLLFCIGPLALLGALSDGLGTGIDQLALKSALDFFAAIAFAATLGWGVAFAALPVGVLQGTVTVIGVTIGSFLPDAQIAAITATGGVLLLGIGARLLRVRQVAVADLLPALVAAPLLTAVVGALT